MIVFPLYGGTTGTACSMQMIGVAVLNLALYGYLKPRVCRCVRSSRVPGCVRIPTR